MANYYDLKPINAFVKSEQILKNSNESAIPCKIIALSIYKDEVITATIMLDCGAVFSYIPFNSLSLNPKSEFPYELRECHSVNSPDSNIDISYLESLKNSSLFFKHFGKDSWLPGEYICTVDFYKDNELVNLICDENGDLLLRPFHKILFNQEPKDIDKINFKQFKKQRKTYKIEI